MAVYTKRGDQGKTSLYDKTGRQVARVSKTDPVVQALGAIDELNSLIGVTVTFDDNSGLTPQLKEIQKNLLTIGTIIAGSGLRFSATHTKKLEKLIDKLEGKLPALGNFVFPGGTPLAAHLQYCRAMSRRAERRVVALASGRKVSPQVLSYLNRLSDALFMLARDANLSAGVKDEIWKGRK